MVQHRHHHGPVHGGLGGKDVLPHAGEQPAEIGVIHRSAVPVLIGHIRKGGGRDAAHLQPVDPLDAPPGQPGADGDPGGGVLPRQIPVSLEQSPAGGQLLSQGHVDYGPAVLHRSLAGQHQKAASGLQVDPVPPAEGAGGKAPAVGAALPGRLTGRLLQPLHGGPVGLVHLIFDQLGPLGRHGGDVGAVQITQGDQTVPLPQSKHRPGQQHPRRPGRQSPAGPSPFHRCSSCASRWEII